MSLFPLTDIFLLFQAQATVPDAFYIGINILVLLVLLVLSGLVSGSEVAFFSLSPENIEEADKRNGLGYALLPKLNQNPKNLLATILILNNFINVAIVTLSTIFTWNLFGLESNPKGLAVAILTLVVTILIVFIGEVIPKVYASQQVLRFAAFTAPLLNASMSVFRPLAWFLINMSKIIERRIQHKGYDISVDELTHALELTENFSSSEEEKEILKGIVNFGTLTVRQIMTSRIDITAVDIEIDFHELMDRVNKTGFSRLPVYNETIDKIEGILYIKDFLPHIENDEHFAWQQLIRPPFFVPENKRVDKLLSDFQQKRVHVAIVVDEYGGTQGLVTMEDIIEEIVGELDDEFDDETVFHQRIDPNTFVFEGKVSLNDFCKVIQVDQEIFDEVKGESESLAGLILELLGRIPGPGERIKYQNFLFTVMAVDNRRIKRVRVFMNPETAKDPAEFID
jgi:gliding motility-associated protein GldE